MIFKFARSVSIESVGVFSSFLFFFCFFFFLLGSNCSLEQLLTIPGTGMKSSCTARHPGQCEQSGHADCSEPISDKLPKKQSQKNIHVLPILRLQIFHSQTYLMCKTCVRGFLRGHFGSLHSYLEDLQCQRRV